MIFNFYDYLCGTSIEIQTIAGEITYEFTNPAATTIQILVNLIRL